MSIRGKMVHVLLRHRHLLQGKLRPEVIDKHTSIAALRKQCDAGAKRLCKPIRGITYVEAACPVCYAEWVIPEQANPAQVVLYFHGGGFVMGNAVSHRNIVGGFVKRLGIKALVFNYSLAPEHAAPQAVLDSAAVYTWLLQQGYAAENIVFAGDSAGGGIALATLLYCKQEAIPLPKACAVFSPCTDMTISGASHKTRAKADPCTPKGMTETYLGYYVGGGDAKHPYASPLFGDLRGLPPIMIQVGNDETLRDDSTRFAEKAVQAGVQVQIMVWKGMFHCFPLLAPAFPEATMALNQVCEFFRQTLNQGQRETKVE